jgi:hypothetical protein
MDLVFNIAIQRYNLIIYKINDYKQYLNKLIIQVTQLAWFRSMIITGL